MILNRFECFFPPGKDIPDPKNPKVVYCRKGIRELRLISPQSHQPIYLEYGALAISYIYGEGVHNVTIRGRGIIDARGYTNKPKKICEIEFRSSKSIIVKGIGLPCCELWQLLLLLCPMWKLNT